MENITSFEIIASLASILSLVVTLVTLQRVNQINNNYKDTSRNKQEVKGKKNKVSIKK